MKYELIIENNLKKINLKRVRIKVDPSLVCQTEDLSQCDGYEGYILAETGDVPKVLVMTPAGVSSVMDIPQQFLQSIMSEEESAALRAFKDYICNICELDTAAPEAELLLAAETIEEVESILKTVGLTDEELKVLYRNFITDSEDTIREGAFDVLLGMAKNTGKAVLNSIKSPAAWIKGAGNVYSALGGKKGGALLNKVGDTVSKGYQMYKAENIKQLADAFNTKHINIADFVDWLNNKPAAAAKVPVKPTIILNAATRKEIEYSKPYIRDITDIYRVIIRNKLDINKFMSDAKTYLNSVGIKAPAGTTTIYNGKTYIADVHGSWGTPAKSNPTVIGIYAPRALNPLITASWIASTKP